MTTVVNSYSYKNVKCIVHFKFAKRGDLERSHPKGNFYLKVTV